MPLDLTDAGLIPEYLREEVETQLSHLIYEVFVETANEDYIAARFMAINGMQRQFYWSSLQVVEKYFKAFLLFNGKKITKRGHKIVGMYDSLSKMGVIDFLDELKPSPALIATDMIYEWGSCEVRDFVEKVSIYGNTSSRYDCVSYKYDLSDLFKLDCFVKKFGWASDEILNGNKRVSKYFFDFNYYFSSDDYNHPSPKGLAYKRFSVSKLSILLKGMKGEKDIYNRWIDENLIYDKENY